MLSLRDSGPLDQCKIPDHVLECQGQFHNNSRKKKKKKLTTIFIIIIPLSIYKYTVITLIKGYIGVGSISVLKQP